MLDDGRQLSALIGRPATPLEELIKLALGRWMNDGLLM